MILGLVMGLLYERTRNLLGASLFHSVTDFSGTALPLGVRPGPPVGAVSAKSARS